MSVARPVRRFRRLLETLNGDSGGRLWLLVACAMLLAVQAGGEPARLALRYERDALAAGQWWRLLSAHFIHLDFEHAVLNALGLVLMWALFFRDYRVRGWLLVVICAIATIDAGLWMRDSTVRWYVGSSGALHGILAAGVLAHLRRRDRDGWLLASFLVAKLAYEQWSGALPFAQGGAVIVNAHLYGAVGGLAAILLNPRREPL